MPGPGSERRLAEGRTVNWVRSAELGNKLGNGDHSNHPNAERPFRAPFVPVVPILGILSCLLLMFSLPTANWWRLFAWLALGLLIYFLYGRHHSVLTRVANGTNGAVPGAAKADVEPVAGG